MNRRYTRANYLALVEKLRAAMPDMGLSTDFIAGFPNESEADFADSLSLLNQVRFNAAFVFLFSPRPGTAAATMPNQVPKDTVAARHAALLSAQQTVTAQLDAALVGQTLPVLFENLDTRTGKLLIGRTETGRSVNGETCDFTSDSQLPPAACRLIGQIAPVLITRAGAHTLHGQVAEEVERKL